MDNQSSTELSGQVVASTELAVTPRDYLKRSWSRKETDKALDELGDLAEADEINFTGARKRNGGVLITCADAQVVEWLRKTAAELKMEVHPPAKLERKIRVTGSCDTKTLRKENVLRSLEKNNSGLRTDKWNVISRSEDTRGASFVFEIDGRSLGWLRARRNTAKITQGLRNMRFCITQEEDD